MILIPNFANRAPSDGVSNAVLSFPVSIETVSTNPTFLGDVDDRGGGFEIRQHRIASSVYRCPVPVLNAVLCDDWQLDVNVSIGTATLTATAQSLTISSTIGKRSGQDRSDTASYSGSATNGPDSVSVDIDVTLANYYFGRTLKQWSLPIYINIGGVNCQFSIGRQVASGTTGASYSGVTITVAGETVLLYDTLLGGSSEFPTGTITMTPVSWLPLS